MNPPRAQSSSLVRLWLRYMKMHAHTRADTLCAVDLAHVVQRAITIFRTAQGEQIKGAQAKLAEANEHTERAGGTLTMLGISLACEGWIQSFACFLCIVLVVLIVLMQMHIL